MLAAKKGHKDVILTLTQRGAKLDLVNAVSVHEHMLYYKAHKDHYFEPTLIITKMSFVH